jgi:hypothetical protein
MKPRTRRANVIPPRAKEGVVTTGNLLRENIDGLVVEGRETAEQCVEDASHSPHVDRLAVTLIFDNLGSGVADRAARSHGLFIPHDLRETEVCDFDATDATTANARDEFTFVLLLLIVRALNRVLRWDDRNAFEQQVLRFDVAKIGYQMIR